MPRSLSWLDRIVPIARSVGESSRSHYDRKELQYLFELQPRAAQQLMAALPNISIGRARLVEREALLAFLRRLNDSAKPAETFAHMRAEGGKAVRRSLREFSLQDYPANVDSPPRMMKIERGELRVRFQTLEELAEAMLYLATVFTQVWRALRFAMNQPGSRRRTKMLPRTDRAHVSVLDFVIHCDSRSNLP